MRIRHMFVLVLRTPPRSNQRRSSAASDVYKRRRMPRWAYTAVPHAHLVTFYRWFDVLFRLLWACVYTSQFQLSQAVSGGANFVGAE